MPASIETAGRVRKHRVDLARFRRKVGAGNDLAAIVARYLFEQPLKLRNVPVDRLLEFAVRAVLLADDVECLLTLQRIEPAGEHVAFAALVTIPKVGRSVVIDHPRNIDGQRIERLDGVARWPIFARPGRFAHDVTRRFAGRLAWNIAHWLVFVA